MNEPLTDILVSLASNAPIIAFLLWQLERQRADFTARLTRKDQIIDKFLERDRELTDKALDKIGL